MKLIVLLALVSTTQALNCYVCSGSNAGGNAGGNCFETVTLNSTKCDSGEDQCVATETTKPNERADGVVISFVRSCISANSCKPATVKVDNTATVTKCCDQDDCNGDFDKIPSSGATVKVSIVGTLIGLLVALWTRN